MADLPARPETTAEVTLDAWKREIREELDRDKREQELRADIALCRQHLADVANVAAEVHEALLIVRKWGLPLLVAVGGGRLGLDAIGYQIERGQQTDSQHQEAP